MIIFSYAIKTTYLDYLIFIYYMYIQKHIFINLQIKNYGIQFLVPFVYN